MRKTQYGYWILGQLVIWQTEQKYLILVAKVTDQSYCVKFYKDGLEICKEKGEVQMKVVRRGDAYFVFLSNVKEAAYVLYQQMKMTKDGARRNVFHDKT